LIELSNVNLTYDGAARPALTDVSLTIGEGEAVAIVGPSGSGKTSLVRLLNALLLPTSGRVIVDGLDTSDPANVWQVRRRVGLIFQNPDNQLVSTTVERELAFGMENLGLPSGEIAARIEDTLERLDLVRLRDRAPHRLSGGEKQRVAIAAVLAMRPDCLALDEPTSLLDGVGRREVWEILRELRRDTARTVVHVTQFPEEITLSSRAVVLAGGRVVFDGLPGELFRRSDRLSEWGLARPSAMEIAARLREAGYPIPEAAMTVGEVVEGVLAGCRGGAA
jgi:energy-coupling factor transport system ATP-binding protein